MSLNLTLGSYASISQPHLCSHNLPALSPEVFSLHHSLSVMVIAHVYLWPCHSHLASYVLYQSVASSV